MCIPVVFYASFAIYHGLLQTHAWHFALRCSLYSGASRCHKKRGWGKASHLSRLCVTVRRETNRFGRSLLHLSLRNGYRDFLRVMCFSL